MLLAAPLILFSSLLPQRSYVCPAPAQKACAHARSPPLCMGRAERRASAKRAKKGSAGARGAPFTQDILSRDAVLSKLREVPVFGLLADMSDDGRPSYVQAADGASCFFMDPREAERECAKLGSSLQVHGISLDQVYFDPSVRLKASPDGVREANTVVQNHGLKLPLFAIDGLTLKDKPTGVVSTPLFFSKSELLEFARTCMDAPEEQVLLTELDVVVQKMLNGPVGPLRDCKLFPTATSLVAMDQQANKNRQQLFPGQSSKEVPDVFKGLFSKFQ
ncbi:hypothetical protein AB1Y20_000084 [Prymnesium parvum]|uniref:Uncharacterized protein n=1 Tax=Prymnesium parvum TaxID=97485 RepID=A0AB34K3X3_PRYPA